MNITMSLENFNRKPLKEEISKIKYQRRNVSQDELTEHIKKRSRYICQLYRR